MINLKYLSFLFLLYNLFLPCCMGSAFSSFILFLHSPRPRLLLFSIPSIKDYCRIFCTNFFGRIQRYRTCILSSFLTDFGLHPRFGFFRIRRFKCTNVFRCTQLIYRMMKCLFFVISISWTFWISTYSYLIRINILNIIPLKTSSLLRIIRANDISGNWQRARQSIVRIRIWLEPSWFWQRNKVTIPINYTYYVTSFLEDAAENSFQNFSLTFYCGKTWLISSTSPISFHFSIEITHNIEIKSNIFTVLCGTQAFAAYNSYMRRFKIINF